MSDNIRTFIGIPVQPTPELKLVFEQLSEMHPLVKLVDPNTMHITLKFVGDMHPKLVQPIADILVQTARRMSAMDLPIRGLGAFPNDSQPSILWAALVGTKPIRQLASDLESALIPLGFEPENRPYRPHITLARLRQNRNRRSQANQGSEMFHQLLEQQKETDFGTISLRSAVLYKSTLTESGPIYTSLAQTDFR